MPDQARARLPQPARLHVGGIALLGGDAPGSLSTVLRAMRRAFQVPFSAALTVEGEAPLSRAMS